MENMINLTVVLTGAVAELAHDPKLEYALVPPAKLATLLELMGLRRPELGAVLPSCRVTVNGAAADTNSILSDGDKIEIVSCQ
jgi:sulfur carrier protein ThiS